MYQAFIVWKRPSPSHGHAANNGHGKLEKIEAELAAIHAMSKQETCTLQRKEGRRYGIVNARGVDHIFAQRGTTIRIAKGDKAKTQANMEEPHI